MKKVVGYAISIAGIAVMALGFGMVKVSWKILETIKPNYIVIVGVAAIATGVIIALKSDDGSRKKKSHKGGHDEIPIYEGTGKNRKVVGYRKD